MPIDDACPIVQKVYVSNHQSGIRQDNQDVILIETTGRPVDLFNITEHFHDAPHK